MYTLLIHFIMHLRSFARVDAHVFAGLDVFVCFVFVIAVFFSLSLHFVFFCRSFFFVLVLDLAIWTNENILL